MADYEVGPEAVRLPATVTWHLAHSRLPETLCGLPVLYGSRRRLWADTSERDRCQLCLARLGL